MQEVVVIVVNLVCLSTKYFMSYRNFEEKCKNAFVLASSQCWVIIKRLNISKLILARFSFGKICFASNITKAMNVSI